MIAYTITKTNKIWMLDESKEDTIPAWCYNKDGYFVVETLPDDIQAMVDEQNAQRELDDYKKSLNSKIQILLNRQALNLGYDNINSIGKYIGYDNPYREQAEGLGTWTANVWATAEQIQQDVLNGDREMPTVDEVLAELPKYGE